MSEVDIAVSVLSVEKENAVSVFYNLETAKINYFHIDVMDGKFVQNNNLEIMKDYALTISHISNVGLDVHLMVENVEEIMDEYIELNPKIITFHYEAIKEETRMMNIINDIKENGIQVGIAINPNTDIKEIYQYLPYIHQVLVMTVEPGKGGQILIPKTIEKIEVLKKYINNSSLDINIEVDGGINDITSSNVKNAGADILVSGKYIIESKNYLDSIQKLKEE